MIYILYVEVDKKELGKIRGRFQVLYPGHILRTYGVEVRIQLYPIATSKARDLHERFCAFTCSHRI